MPRELVLSNGSLLVALDRRYAIRDLFYPRVGYPNHLSGHPIRSGLWLPNGAFSWLDGDEWQREFSYEPGTLVARLRLEWPSQGVSIETIEAVLPGAACYVRRINIRGAPGAKLFFAHDLRIAESDIGDTAFYHPATDSMIHYKGRYYCLFGGRGPLGGLSQYAAGIKGFGGMEGTWRDAEDGRLSMHAIAQGSVDSTFSLDLPASQEAEVWYWAMFGDTLETVVGVHAQSSRRTASLIDETQAWWQGWSSATADFCEALDKPIARLAVQSAALIQAHCDSGGAMIASIDSDIMATNRANYAYMWPRDGALGTSTLALVGRPEAAARFLAFCASLVEPPRSWLMQKYWPDGSLGASWHPWVFEGRPEVPIQEDQTALTLLALCEHLSSKPNAGQADRLLPFGLRLAELLYEFRAPNGLPLPSWDLWEERRGIHAYTCAAVSAALAALSSLTGAHEIPRADAYREAAHELRLSALDALTSPEGLLRRRLDSHGAPDDVPDASVLGALLLGLAPPSDPRYRATVEHLATKLRVGGIGGIARYDGDYYFRAVASEPGNPWIITTMWLARARLELGGREGIEGARHWLDWAVGLASPAGMLPEQVHPHTGEHLSVSPLAWSHAEFIRTALAWKQAVSGQEG